METLGEREVSDMITDLRKSEDAEGTCKKHGLVVRSAILSHRQQEQTYEAVISLSAQVQKLVIAEEQGNNFIGGFKFGKKQASGLVAIIVVICLFACVWKWGPNLVNFLQSKPDIERTVNVK